MSRFDNSIVLITGAGTGIGLATTRRIRAEGGTVIASMLDIPGDVDFAGAQTVQLDVTDDRQWEQVVSTIVAEHGRIDVLINNAGIRETNLAEDTSLEQWHRLVNTNLMSVFLGCRTVIPIMRRGGGGAIVNVSSITGIRGVRKMAAYSASKSGIVALTASLALDHAPDNIRVNAVCPGAIETPMLATLLDEAADREAAVERMIGTHPIGRLGRPEEVASVIAFLASDDASFLTGLSIPVDGGRSIR
jgi:meso-butanediol dehydrogenase/(S,S)-butanediol dehydrogenase/diacetyl reductase